MRRTRAFCAVLLFFSLFHQEWGATHSYDMEPVSDSCKRHFLNLSRHNKSNKTMWGFGFLSAQGLLLTKFDFIVPPWTSCGVEFQAYYTSPTEKQCKKGSPNITQRAVFKIYNSNLEEIHKDTVFINLTTTPQEYSLQWDDIKIDNSPEVYASMMVDYESNRPEGYIVHITFSKDKDLPDIPAYYVTDDSHMALQDLTNETLNSVEEISQTSFRALGHGDPPAGWTCPPQYYMDGICDCDCGAVEPECPTGHCFPFHVAECGNTILEDTEECEVGGLGCSDDCRCAQGYTSVEKIDCEPVCGDGVVVEGEECDGVEFCNESCVCTDGYTPSQNQENECVPKKQIHDNDGGKSVGKLTVVLYTLLSVFIFVMIVFATVIYLIKRNENKWRAAVNMNEITGIVHSNGDESHSDGNDYYAIKNSWSPKTNCSKYNSDNDDISYTDTDDKSNNNESSSENSTEENLLSDSSSNSISISINNHSKKHTSKSNASNTKPKKKKKTKKDDKREEREEREEEDDDDDDDDDDFGASEENTLIRIKNRSTEYDEECTVKASYMWRVLPRVLNVESAPLEIGTPRQFSVVVESMVFVMMLRITLPPPNEEITFEPRSSNTIVLKSGSKGSSEAFFFDVTMHYLTHVKTSIAVTAYYEVGSESFVERMEIPCNFKSKLCTHLRSEDFALIGPVQVRPAVTIKKGTWRNVPVIVKEYKQTGNEQRKMARNEARTFERVSRSPYIIHALGVTVSPTWIGLVFEALRYGTLDNAIVRFTLSQAIKLRIALEIARGLAFLHHKHIVHRNFRTNIVACLSLQASSPVLVRIASLSMAGHVRHGGGGGGALRGLTHLIHNNYVNPRYCAPEILTDQDVYGTEVDLYSYACVFYELWNEKTVFPDVGNDITPSDTFVSEIIEGKRPELADTCPPAVRNIIAKCWATDPKKRPTFEEVIAVLEAEGAGAENTTATPINGINPNSGFEGGGSATGPSVVPPGSPSLFYDETADAQEDETAGRTPLCEGQLMLRPCALDADLTMSPSPSVGASASPVPPTAQNPPTPLTFSLLSTSK